MATEEEISSGRGVPRRPRALAMIGLLAGVVGFLVTFLPAVVGPGGLSGGYLAVLSLFAVLPIGVIVVAIGSMVSLLMKRASGIALMLGGAMFVVGWLAGYLRSQQLCTYY